MRLCSVTPVWGAFCLVRVYERDHAADPGKKSSAITAPLDVALSLAASSHDGLVRPRRSRLIVVRSTLTKVATSSSVKPREAIHMSSFMESNVHLAHNSCQAPCASGGVDWNSTVRIMHSMAKSKKSKKKPKFGKHFVLEWRLAFNLGQEELADRMGYAHSTIQRVETFQVGYTQKFIEKAALVFGCPPGLLLLRPPRPDEIRRDMEIAG